MQSCVNHSCSSFRRPFGKYGVKSSFTSCWINVVAVAVSGNPTCCLLCVSSSSGVSSSSATPSSSPSSPAAASAAAASAPPAPTTPSPNTPVGRGLRKTRCGPKPFSSTTQPLPNNALPTTQLLVTPGPETEIWVWSWGATYGAGHAAWPRAVGGPAAAAAARDDDATTYAARSGATGTWAADAPAR